MEQIESRHLILRIAEYGLHHNRLNYRKMAEDLGIRPEDEEFVVGLLSQLNPTDNPNHVLVAVHRETASTGWRDATYSLAPTAFYSYVDYLELKEARAQANEARKQSELAIRLTVFTLLVSVIIGLAGLFLTVMQFFITK